MGEQVSPVPPRSYDVVLPVVPRDLPLACLVVDLARTMLRGMRRLILVVPDRAVELVEGTGLADVVIGEDTIDPVLERTPAGWFKQQIVKLCAHRVVDTDAFLVLDADVLTLRPVVDDDLFVDARPKFFVEDPSGGAHPDWIEHAAAFVGVPAAGTPSYFPTPNLMHVDVLERLHAHLSRRHGGDAVEVMLRHHGHFTEWATYGIFAASDPAAAARHAFVVERHAAGLWTPDEAAAWLPDASIPFLIAHSWAPIPLVPLAARVRGLTGPIRSARGAVPVAMVPAGVAGVRVSDAGREPVVVPVDRPVLPRDIVEQDTERVRVQLRRDRWGDDLGGGVLEIAARDLRIC